MPGLEIFDVFGLELFGKVDDSPVDGSTNTPISSNWAYDHGKDLDAHTLNIGEQARVGAYHIPLPAGTPTAVAWGANNICASLFWVSRTMTFDRLGIQITVAAGAGKKARLGIWNVDSDFYPTTLVVDGGEVAIDGVTIVAATINQQLTKGWYAIGFLLEDGCTIKCQSGYFSPRGMSSTDLGTLVISYYKAGQTYQALGSFPSGATEYSATSGVVPRIASLD